MKSEPVPAVRSNERAHEGRSLSYVIGESTWPRQLVALAVFISLFETGATLISPLLTKAIVDGIGAGHGPGLGFGSPLTWLILTLIAGGIAGGLSSYLQAKAGTMVSSNLKKKMAARILHSPVSYFDAQESGDYVSRISNDVGVIAKLLTSDAHGLVVGLFLFTGSVVVLCLLDLSLTLVIVGVIAAGFVLMTPSVLKLARITKRMNDANARLNSALFGLFREVRLVKAFTAEDTEAARAGMLIDNYNESSLQSARVKSLLTPVTSLALSVAIVSILVYGGARIESGTLAFGTLTAFILYIFNIVAPMFQLSVFFAGLQAARGSAGRLREILEASAEDEAVAPVGDPAVLRPGRADLAFRNVELRYGGAARSVVAIEELTLPSGQSTAIVGPSGAGKTSFLSLIERYYEPSHGAISWGGVDIRRFALRDWRRGIGYVAQSAPLLSGSIRENIEYGLAAPADEVELRRAAEAADCLAFVDSLPQGFESQVGEAGVRLSGGQRQRIAIARVMLRDPSLLLLDEPTSSLDAESEEAVLHALRVLMQGRTTILATHRLSVLKDVDNILILEAGRISGFGPKNTILGDSAYFARLARFSAEAENSAPFVS